MTNTTFSTGSIVFIFLCLITFGIAATVAFNQNKEIGDMRSQNQVLIEQNKKDAEKIEALTKLVQTFTADKANLENAKKVLEDVNLKLTAENLILKTQLVGCTPANPNGTDASSTRLPASVTQTPPAVDKAETQPWLTIFSSAAALLTLLYTTARKWNDRRSNQITVRMDRSTFTEYVRYMRSR